MSTERNPPAGDDAWVPSAEHPVPPTTEFGAVSPEGVEPISGSSAPDETPAAAAPTPGAASPEPDVTTEAPAPAPEPPAWKTPAASGLPPQWGDPSAQDADASGPGPQNGVQNLWGLVPEDRPEVAIGAALAAGVLAAILVRTLARR